MSQTHPSHPDSESGAFSHSNYQHIFSHALESYRKRTGNDLTSNPLLPRLEACNSPDSVIALLRQQIPGFGLSRSDNDSGRLSNWLNPTVNVITAFSRNISDIVSPVGLEEFSQNLDADTYSLDIPSRRVDLYRYRNSSLSELPRSHQYHTLRFAFLREKFLRANTTL
jgi:hypothetical protein